MTPQTLYENVWSLKISIEKDGSQKYLLWLRTSQIHAPIIHTTETGKNDRSRKSKKITFLCISVLLATKDNWHEEKNRKSKYEFGAQRRNSAPKFVVSSIIEAPRKTFPRGDRKWKEDEGKIEELNGWKDWIGNRDEEKEDEISARSSYCGNEFVGA